jgi:hypothetical protein
LYIDFEELSTSDFFDIKGLESGLTCEMTSSIPQRDVVEGHQKKARRQETLIFHDQLVKRRGFC